MSRVESSSCSEESGRNACRGTRPQRAIDTRSPNTSGLRLAQLCSRSRVAAGVHLPLEAGARLQPLEKGRHCPICRAVPCFVVSGFGAAPLWNWLRSVRPAILHGVPTPVVRVRRRSQSATSQAPYRPERFVFAIANRESRNPHSQAAHKVLGGR